jgi:hypothetical protein
MFLLVTGASGAGRSTVRRAIAHELSPAIECVELSDVVSMPGVPDLAWRQQATEVVVERALELQAEGRHLLLSGDPVAAGEVLAAPSAAELAAAAVCLLDVTADAQSERLADRGDDPRLVPHHHAFAKWMRRHARDPRHMPHVLTTSGWPAMRWDRWTGLHPADGVWGMHVIDTSAMTPEHVAAAVVAWVREALQATAPIFHPGDL